MRVVSSRSDADIRRTETSKDLTTELRELAANLLRIIRGAGKPHALRAQLESCLKAAAEYHEAHGMAPDADFMHRVLDCDQAQLEFRPWIKERLGSAYPSPRQDAESWMRRACLQIAASMLVDQLTQRTAATKDLYDAIDELERVKTDARRARKSAAIRSRETQVPAGRRNPTDQT